MSAPSPAAPPPSSLLPVVVAIALHLALVVAGSGVAAVLTDRDPIDYPDAGPLLGPVMIAAGAVAVALAARAVPRAAHPGSIVLLGAIGAVLTTVVVGAVGYALVRGQLAWLVLAAAHIASSPLAVVTAVSAALAVGAARLFARVPRVPLERGDAGAGPGGSEQYDR